MIAHQQRAYKQRAERDALRAEQAERQRVADLAALQRLKAQYETPGLVAA